MLITISRQTGSQGKEITELLAQKLNLPIITRDLVMSRWMPEIANQHELHMLTQSAGFFLSDSSQGITFADFLENKLKELVYQQSVIIFGLGAQIIFDDYTGALHVKIMASQEIRINRIMQTHCLEKKDAERFLDLTDRKHRRYISTIYGKDWSDPSLYHITLNTDNLSIDEAVSVLYYMAQNRQSLPSSQVDTLEKPTEKSVVFKHPSEEEFAAILDMHNIEWQYEPRTFPIEWDTEGNITQAFAPDFYLPRFDTYIELTTMDQRYVSQKKKKVQKLKKLYPGTNINIVFKKDFYSLAKRFGLGEDNNRK
ncbi:MAG: cytidylate kinase family protein [Syntrophomonadaceae bacterium]